MAPPRHQNSSPRDSTSKQSSLHTKMPSSNTPTLRTRIRNIFSTSTSTSKPKRRRIRKSHISPPMPLPPDTVLPQSWQPCQTSPSTYDPSNAPGPDDCEEEAWSPPTPHEPGSRLNRPLPPEPTDPGPDTLRQDLYPAWFNLIDWLWGVKEDLEREIEILDGEIERQRQELEVLRSGEKKRIEELEVLRLSYARVVADFLALRREKEEEVGRWRGNVSEILVPAMGRGLRRPWSWRRKGEVEAQAEKVRQLLRMVEERDEEVFALRGLVAERLERMIGVEIVAR